MGEVYYVPLHILLDHEPWPSSESQSLALAYGAEPMPLVLADKASCLELESVAFMFAEISAQVVVVVYLTKKTDAL